MVYVLVEYEYPFNIVRVLAASNNLADLPNPPNRFFNTFEGRDSMREQLQKSNCCLVMEFK